MFLKINLEYKEIKKAIRSFIYNLMFSTLGAKSFKKYCHLPNCTVPSDLKEQIPTRNQKHLFKDFYDEELFRYLKKRFNFIEQLTYKDFQKR